MKLETVGEINDRVGELEDKIQTLKNLKSKLIDKRYEMEMHFANGSDCPECGSSKSKTDRGFGRGYTVECKNCGFRVHGSD